MAAANINVNKQTVLQLLTSGQETPFVIPEYQRPYSWSEDEICTLFDDLWNFSVERGKDDGAKSYFLGCVVSYHENSERQIIDGQQRITSLFLLLRAIFAMLESAVAEAIANAVAHRDYTSNASVQVMLFRDRLEIWNPGRLPDGFTIQKLHEVHRSEPTNPVLAHPLFMAGYIEHLGTGTTDMIADCEALGLRTPEFIQADDFRTIIYRQEKVSDPTEKVTEQGQKVTEWSQKVTELDEKSNGAEQKSNQVRLTAKQRKVLEFCDATPRTAQEILEMVGVKYQTKTREQYVNKLVLAGLLRPTTTHKNDSNRRYITAHPSNDR